MPRVKTCVKEDTGQVALTEHNLPDPGPGQALIRTTMTTICGSDIHICDDIPEVPLGMPMGHEGVGIVEAVGEGVERFRPGDKVVACCLMSCGSCGRCTDDQMGLCETLGAPMNLVFGAQGEAFICSGADYSLARLPEAVDDRQGMFVADILSTGFGAIERGELRAGQSVAIFAQGPVGLCATLGAKHYGAEPIIAVEGLPERREMAKRLGATHVVSPGNAHEEIMKITGGRGVDLAVECLGKQETFENCCKVTRLGGTVSSVGVYAGIPSLSLPTDGSFVHRKIVTTFCPAGSERLEFLLDLIQAGKVDPTPMLTHESSLANIVDSYDQFRHRHDGVIKIAITV
ncbi:MAG: zinc-binding dehydrogenase [Candidatus Binatia bacterium]